jgi:hypothetical protein
MRRIEGKNPVLSPAKTVGAHKLSARINPVASVFKTVRSVIIYTGFYGWAHSFPAGTIDMASPS